MFDFRLTQDNKLEYLFYFVSFSSSSTVEIDYFGTETVQVPKTVGVPNPFAGPNSTVSPTITTNTLVSMNRSTWVRISPSPFQVIQLSPTVRQLLWQSSFVFVHVTRRCLMNVADRLADKQTV